LARTINNLDQIESSRIHIVLPERAPFQEDTVDPSASVVVKMKPNKTLSEQQIKGITALISGSVGGLSQNDVVILDQHGNQITTNAMENSLSAVGTEQHKVRKSVENYLTNKGQSMLDRVVGPGNSILRVSTRHNFKEVTLHSNLIDPESRTILSEETRRSENSNRSEDTGNEQLQTGNTATQQEESIVEVKNYAMSETNKIVENTVGDITHISASVLLNYKTVTNKNEDGEVTESLEPYTDQELAEIREIMSSTLGLNSQRGDLLTVKQIKFKDPYSLQPQSKPFFGDEFSVYELIRLALIIIVASVIGILMY